MKIKKAQLDTLISMNRGYWNHDITGIGLIDAKCKAMHLYARKTFGEDFGMELCALVSTIIKGNGLKPEATNEDIYKVLEVLGYEVVE